MSQGKKYVVISQEEYQMLKQKQPDKRPETKIIINSEKRELLNPEKVEMERSEAEMENIWDKQLPIDEKIRLFTEELNNLKKRYEKLKRPRGNFIEKANNKKEKEKEDMSPTMEENLLKSLPTMSRNNGTILLDHLKKYPKILSWSDNGEVSFKGDLIPGSNLTDLISSVTTNRKSNTPLLAQTIFLKALAETNIPESWIKNKMNRKLLQSYKSLTEENPYKSPDFKKMKKQIWQSSV